MFNDIHNWIDTLFLEEFGIKSHFTADAIAIVSILIICILLYKIFLDIRLIIKLIKQNKQYKKNFDKIFLKLLVDKDKEKKS